MTQESESPEVIIPQEAKDKPVLPLGFAAVVVSSSEELKTFAVKIGEPIVHKTERALEKDLKKRASDWYIYPGGPHVEPEHWTGFKPLEQDGRVKGWTIMVEYGREEGKVNLSLVNSLFDRHFAFSTETVEESVFTENGFALTQDNSGEWRKEGLILSPELSQRLYEFQANPGRFEPQPKQIA
jgi:hypothetical protein